MHKALQTVKALNRGERFKAARMAMGYSQRQVHEFTGIARSTIEELEHGEERIPYRKTVYILARAYNVPMWWLMEGL